MERLLAQDAIQRVVISFNRAEDDLDFELFQTCFLPGQEFELDLSKHLPDTPARQLSAQQFWQEMQSTVAGFTGTHHHLGPLQFDFHDSKHATASATVVVTYSMQLEDGNVSAVIVKALQVVDTEEVEGRWIIRRFKVIREVPMENLNLFGLAIERVQKGLQRQPKK